MSKYAIYGLIIQTILSSVLIASDGEAQSQLPMDKIYLSLDLHNQTLRSAFRQITKQSDLKFAYEEGKVGLNKKVDQETSGKSLREVLQGISTSNRLSFKRIGNQIFVSKPKGTQFIHEIIAKVTVTGKVSDENGEALPGVSILEKGTSNGTITDASGIFQLDVVDDNAILIFSFVGYLPQEIPVNGKSELNIEMSPDIQALEDIIVVGYGEQRKISFTGAQSSIPARELDHPVANISTMLAGRLAGITGVQRSGEPGYDGADIWIRGISTMSGGSNPLVLVDGVERSMNNIEPQDIESFTILKDASATAVYGVRGANGVILINTKKGKEGKPKVVFDYNQGITMFTKTPELLGGVDYMKLSNEALTTRGEAPRYSQEVIERTESKYDPFVYPDVNWMEEVFRDHGNNRQASLNVNGGSATSKYYVSLGYYDETGLYNTDALAQYNSSARFTRYNVTTNINMNLTPTTKVDLGIQGYLADGNYPGESANTIFNGALEVSPVEYPVMYPGGYVPGRSPNGGMRNPYADATLRGYQNHNRNQLYSNLRVTQDLSGFTEGLSVTTMFAFDVYNEHRIQRRKREDTWIVDVNNPRNPDGTLNLGTVPTFQGQNFLSYSRSNGGNRRFYMETSLNYDRAFDRHRVGGLLLFNRSDYLNAFAGDFTESIPYRNQGLAGRITYSYDDRYFIEFNAGYNGSENFAPSKRYGFFPAFGFGWAISNEKFFEPLTNVIDFLKVRYTDGKVGSASGAGRFAFIGEVIRSGDSGYTYGKNRIRYDGIFEDSYAVDVTWAEARKQDLGIEINMFNYSLGIIVDVFKEYTEGAFLGRADIPNYVGLSTNPFGNIGIVENKGFDGSINFNKSFKDLVVGFRGTFSYNRNKILENGQPEQLYEWLERRGDPVLARYGFIAERLFTFEDDTDGDGYITTTDGEFAEQFGQIMPGDIKYKDLNEDGRIDAFDQIQIGQGDVPALTYGFGVSLGYRNLDMSLFFQGQAEADIILSGTGIIPFRGDGGGANLYKVALDRWTGENPNPEAMYPRLSYGSAAVGQNNNTQTSTWWLRDIDFLRLKTAEIGYTLPSHIAGYLKMKNARVYMRGVNLLTFSKFDIWDPELLTSNGARYPNSTIFSLGVNIEF
ncbi:TonB-dependent receptor [Fulvivirgaceae bacterium BMA12]|uniref:TonB-dependent receptor n=1 Tax=Agaribacillus aureus TaxID=3051825 RepID=A0ABT8KYE9_9BACT|nr:TonB-dependent receptor [Fulvivirgaceae bacterium BMA12]